MVRARRYVARMTANQELYGPMKQRVAEFLATMPEVDTSVSVEDWHRQREELQQKIRQERKAEVQTKFRYVRTCAPFFGRSICLSFTDFGPTGVLVVHTCGGLYDCCRPAACAPCHIPVQTCNVPK